MKLQSDSEEIRKEDSKTIPLDVQVNALYDTVKNILDDKTIRARIIKYKLNKYLSSKDSAKKIYAVNKIISEGKGIAVIPTNEEETYEAVEDTTNWIVENVAKRYIQNEIENEVEDALVKRQNKYLEEVRLGIIRKKKGRKIKVL